MAIILEPELADDYGLVAVGGDLRPQTLVLAYTRGIFPWYDENCPICWWSPEPRAILPLEQLHVSRRLARTIRSGKFHWTINQAFGQVIRACAERAEGTWLTAQMQDAYTRLHRLGLAHSVEVWHGDMLAGGVYGVALRGFFAGESMFTRIRDGSKLALVRLVEHLRSRNFRLLDIQMLTPHTASMGAVEIPRQDYLERLQQALKQPVTFSDG